jgi:hypothetical protein
VASSVPEEADEDFTVVDSHKKYFGGKKTGRGAPRIDPAWEHSSPGKPPPGASSTERIECSMCHDIHTPKRRKLWNGTFSYCPKCGAASFTPLWDEES